MTITKFGKKSGDVLSIKKNFYTDNDFLLSKQKKISKIYSRQPHRKKCKACDRALTGSTFKNHNIVYIECKYCSHINGKYKDTQKFSDTIYKSSKINYSKNYESLNLKSFQLRQQKIYDPKALFLKQNLNKWKKIKVLDFGCGSGYFISSLIDAGFQNVEGLEVSSDQINYGKRIFKSLNKKTDHLKFIETNEVLGVIKKTDANCISLIGVLEHLVNLKEFLNAIKLNKKIQYIFLCVPMFSLSSIVENNFPDIFNRHLGGGHTHLFTEKSLKKVMNKINFHEVSSWWFGSDFSDLLRSLIVKSQKKNEKLLVNKLTKLQKEIDSLQIVLDKQKLSSQVHMILKKK